MDTEDKEAGKQDATGQDTTDVTTGVIPSGGGYRAVAKRGDRVVWTCPHIHFTEHSAQHCPALVAAA